MTSVELLIYIGILNIQEFNITHCDKKQNLRKSVFFFSEIYQTESEESKSNRHTKKNPVKSILS